MDEASISTYSVCCGFSSDLVQTLLQRKKGEEKEKADKPSFRSGSNEQIYN